MIFTYKPGAPTLPFPTAFPGLGIALSNRISGQHATNPSGLRINSIHPNSQHHRKGRTPIWHVIPYNVTPPRYDNYPLWTRLIQTWLTRWWTTQLSPAQRSAWATFAAAHLLTNMWGTTKYLSPFGAYLNVNRIYLFNYVVPGFPPSMPSPPAWPSPPTSWTPPAYSNLQGLVLMAKWKPYTGSAYGPWYVSAWLNPPLPTTAIQWILYLSYPNKIINARRQGALTMVFSVPAGPNPPAPRLYPTPIFMPSLQPGDIVSAAIQQVDYSYDSHGNLNHAGASAFNWQTIVTSVNPY